MENNNNAKILYVDTIIANIISVRLLNAKFLKMKKNEVTLMFLKCSGKEEKLLLLRNSENESTPMLLRVKDKTFQNPPPW